MVFKTVALIVGTTVIATIRDAIRAYEMVNAKGISKSLIIPVTYTIGRNTLMVVKVEATIGAATCLVPCTAALGADMPCPLNL